MNFTTHVMFGVLVGALFFGKPEIVLLVGVGSAIPDLDREYAFFSRSSFRDHQIHRALCHNYLFLGMLYLINPFVALGAFLHTLLDALTTAKDRGVEWLYPFSRFVKKAANDEHGKPLETTPGEIYLYQYDPIEFTRMSDKDLKEKKPTPWRRTYGPALSGGLLDLGIFVGSFFLFIVSSIVSTVLQGRFVGLSLNSYHFSTMLPLLLAIAGIAVNMLVGELDRRKRRADDAGPTRIQEVTVAASLSLMISAIVVGAYLN
ncbi:MAG: metal-dependent hydrolase, partial [Nitrososphaerales archaeon]